MPSACPGGSLRSSLHPFPGVQQEDRQIRLESCQSQAFPTGMPHASVIHQIVDDLEKCLGIWVVGEVRRKRTELASGAGWPTNPPASRLQRLATRNVRASPLTASHDAPQRNPDPILQQMRSRDGDADDGGQHGNVRICRAFVERFAVMVAGVGDVRDKTGRDAGGK